MNYGEENHPDKQRAGLRTGKKLTSKQASDTLHKQIEVHDFSSDIYNIFPLIFLL
jgi:hypothetical protein